jgi:hypothetical protein
MSHHPILSPGAARPSQEKRGTGVDDPPNRVPRVAGVPTSLLDAAASTATAAAGWFIDRRSTVVPRWMTRQERPKRAA